MRQGFTLIELLAVILIIGILAAVLITSLGDSEDAARMSNTGRRLAELTAVVEGYANDKGGPPPSTFTTEQGVANDGTNVGIEALVVALWSKGYEGGGMTTLEDVLVNTDADSSATNLTDFDTRELLEIPDDWGNPIAYINRFDYEAKGRRYTTYDPLTGELFESSPVAMKNPTTGRFYRVGTFQLISAGPDGDFGTVADNVTNFDVE